MNSDRLSAWIKSEAEKASSFRQLALSLGTSPTTINALRDQQRQTISEDLLQAIALRRKESVAQTAEWLGMDAPIGFDLPQRFNELEQRMVAMERKVEYAYQRLAEQDEVSNADVLNTYLLEHGINVRRHNDQEQMRGHVAAIAGESPGLFERLLLAILGILPISPTDLPAAASLLKRFTGDPWTPAEVTRVINQARVVE